MICFNKKTVVRLIGDLLDHWVPDPKIPLNHSDPFTLLVAVLLSARCTDERVNRVTPELFSLAHTPQKMSQQQQNTVERIIRPCGLAPTKARAIIALSSMLVREYKGLVPNTLKELERLPGIGHKSASVVLAQAFHKPAFPVDTHIHRCAKRWHLSTGKNVTQTEHDLKKTFPKREWIKRHLQIILFARTYCPARGHNTQKCPICSALSQKKTQTTPSSPHDARYSQ